MKEKGNSEMMHLETATLNVRKKEQILDHIYLIIPPKQFKEVRICLHSIAILLKRFRNSHSL